MRLLLINKSKWIFHRCLDYLHIANFALKKEYIHDFFFSYFHIGIEFTHTNEIYKFGTQVDCWP